MKKGKTIRIWLTIFALLCVLAVSAMYTWGVNNDFSDGLILAMKLAGGAGVLLLIANAVLAVAQLIREEERKNTK